MKRSSLDLDQQRFDVIIVGGGIHGAAVAWKCSMQGMKVALIEKADFGGGASANSLKIIHGGFRYLQHLNIKRMRESIVSRRIMSQISPENIRALRCVIPNYGFGLHNKHIMRIALLINDLISFDRNWGVSLMSKIPRGKFLSINDCKEIFPNIDWGGKSGGSIWYDALALNSERLTLAFLHEAYNNGTSLANYTELKQILTNNGAVQGVVSYDSIRKLKFELQAKTVVIASGVDNDRLLGSHQSKRHFQRHWARAINIIVRKKIVSDTAIGLTGNVDYRDRDAIIKKKGRFFFFVPWRGYTMIGTTYTFKSNDEVIKASRCDLENILAEINHILPTANLKIEDISNVHVGMVPAYDYNGGEIQLLKQTEISDLSNNITNPINGLYSIKSVKYTTAPVVAISISRMLSDYLGKPYKEDKITSNNPNENDIPNDKNNRLDIWKRYGKNSKLVSKYISSNKKVICNDPLYYEGEIDYFIEEEMAVKLSDIVFRRSDLASAERPKKETLYKIAEKMSDHFHWDSERITREVDSIEAKFSWL